MTGEKTGSIALVVMAKAPIAGEAKTRLAATVGGALAAALCRAFLLDTMAVLDAAASRFDARGKMLVCPDERHAQMLRGLVDRTWGVQVQTCAGLMGGIADGFDAAFDAGADLAVVSDADSPLALHHHLERCIAVGFEHDIALGPT
jgi:glycosyltransferase A (GT-A) superfamily protein (DUF2064 family)